MKTTTNYALKKPDGTDLVNIEDINANMDTVDAQLKTAANHAVDAAKHITTVATATANGLMAAADKVKLNGVAAGAKNTVIANNLTTTAAGSALDAVQGKILNGKNIEISAELQGVKSALKGGSGGQVLVKNSDGNFDFKWEDKKDPVYEGAMKQFYAIPGASGKIRLKIEMPADSDGVMVRRKTLPWVLNDTKSNGDLVTTIYDDSSCKGANQWYEESGLVNGTCYYYCAFPFKGSMHSSVTEYNTTSSKAGGLICELTMDNISGNTIVDTSGNNAHAINNGCPYSDGKLGRCVSGAATGNYWVAINSGDPDYTATPNGTVMAWVTVKSIVEGTAAIEHDGEEAKQGSIKFGFSGVNDPMGPNKLICHKGFPTNFASVTPEINRPYFMCLKHTGNNIMTRIDDGQWVIGVKDTGHSSYENSPMNLFCGRYMTGNTPHKIYRNFAVDQLRIYDRELSGDEVDNIYNRGVGC